MSELVTKPEKTHWANIKEAGSVFGIRFLFNVHRVFGRPLFTLALYPAVAYYLLVKPGARRASQEYLRQLYAQDPSAFTKPPNLIDTAKHIMSFCQTTLDKLLAWSGPISREDFTFVDQTSYDHIVEDPRGQVVIGSHFGNLEYCRGFTSRSKRRVINALVHDRHAENFANVMARLNPDSRLNLFQVTELDIPVIAELRERLSRGEWVFIAGDRSPVNSSDRTIPAKFLGREAPFPIGPFILAATLQHPLNFLFAYRRDKKIAIKFVNVADSVELKRDTRETELQKLVQQFADELSHHCRIAPLQWFNFFPFWDQNTRYKDK